MQIVAGGRVGMALPTKLFVPCVIFSKKYSYIYSDTKFREINPRGSLQCFFSLTRCLFENAKSEIIPTRFFFRGKTRVPRRSLIMLRQTRGDEEASLRLL